MKKAVIAAVFFLVFLLQPLFAADKPAVGTARFVDKGDGTVLDSEAGLVWTKDGDLYRGKIPWQTAKEYVEKMNKGESPNFGYSDWRLPAIEEMAALGEAVSKAAASGGYFFKNVRDGFYWSSSTGFNMMGYVWMYDMGTGNIVFDFISYCNFQHLWPVRGDKAKKGSGVRIKFPDVPSTALSIISGDVCMDRSGGQTALPVPNPPMTPTNLNIQPISPTEAALSWNQSEGEVKVAWYNVYDKGGALLKTVTENFTTIKDLTPKVQYCFNVTAQDAAGYESERSMQACVATREKIASGTVWSSGLNDTGQIGDGTRTDRLSLVQTLTLEDVKKVSAGQEHVLALKEDGTVWAWGKNDKGQLGDGTSENRLSPVQVKGISGVTDISAGGYHSMALKSDGTIWVWGRNYYGQLGTGNLKDSLVPVKTGGIEGGVDIAAGSYHSVALKSDGTVWTWGWNLRGQLGMPGTGKQGLTKPGKVADIKDAKAAAAGTDFTLIVRADGSVWAWGNNKYGQLGDNTTEDRPAPVRAEGLTDVVDVSAGAEFSAALKKDGTVWSWGRNEHGQAGSKTDFKFAKPIKVEGIDGVKKIASGSYHAVALKKDGTVWAWGWRLERDVERDSIPTQTSGLTDIKDVSAGKRFTVAVKGSHGP